MYSFYWEMEVKSGWEGQKELEEKALLQTTQDLYWAHSRQRLLFVLFAPFFIHWLLFQIVHITADI